VVHAEVTHTSSSDTKAISGISEPQPFYGIGGQFRGGCWGVKGVSIVEGGGNRTGVYGKAQGSPTNFGAYGYAAGLESSSNYGVYGTSSCTGNCTEYGVYSNGDLGYSGSLVGPPSDLKFKEYVEEMSSTLNDLLKLEVVSYQHKLDPQFGHMNLSRGQQVGFVAQQVAEVFPDLVVEAVHPPREEPEGSKELGDPIRYKALKMTQLIPILVRAIQEQQAQIEALKAEIAPLRHRLAELEGVQQESTRLASALPSGR